MNRNIGRWERLLRLGLGILLLAWAVAGGPYWSYVGLALIATGAWGFCPLVWLLRKEQN